MVPPQTALLSSQPLSCEYQGNNECGIQALVKLVKKLLFSLLSPEVHLEEELISSINGFMGLSFLGYEDLIKSCGLTCLSFIFSSKMQSTEQGSKGL